MRALIDAFVLANFSLCDTLLRCAEPPSLFEPRWSEQILVETARTLKSKLDWPRSLPASLQKELRTHFRDAWIEDFEYLAHFSEYGGPSSRRAGIRLWPPGKAAAAKNGRPTLNRSRNQIRALTARAAVGDRRAGCPPAPQRKSLQVAKILWSGSTQTMAAAGVHPQDALIGLFRANPIVRLAPNPWEFEIPDQELPRA